MEAPCEIEVALVREGRSRRCRNAARMPYYTTCGEDRIVRDEPSTGEQRRGGFGRCTLPYRDWDKEQQDGR
jgi:hypothetical protein